MAGGGAKQMWRLLATAAVYVEVKRGRKVSNGGGNRKTVCTQKKYPQKQNTKKKYRIGSQRKW